MLFAAITGSGYLLLALVGAVALFAGKIAASKAGQTPPGGVVASGTTSPPLPGIGTAQVMEFVHKLVESGLQGPLLELASSIVTGDRAAIVAKFMELSSRAWEPGGVLSLTEGWFFAQLAQRMDDPTMLQKIQDAVTTRLAALNPPVATATTGLSK